MIAIIFLGLAAGVATGLKKGPLEFLEANTATEYTPNPEGYLDDKLDLLWVVLGNIYDDLDDLNFVFDSIVDCGLLWDLEVSLENFDEFCSHAESAGIFAVYDVLFDLEFTLETCVISTEYIDQYNAFMVEWASNYPTTVNTELLDVAEEETVVPTADTEEGQVLVINGDLHIVVGCDNSVEIETKEDEENEEDAEDEADIPDIEEIIAGFQTAIDQECSNISLT